MDARPRSLDNGAMTGPVEHRSEPQPLPLRRLVETDRRELIGYLERRPEDNVYLLSRVALDGVVNEASLCHGRFYGHFVDEALDGVAFFGHRRGVVLAGESEPFVRGAAALALGEEAGWVILVSPREAADRFLSHYRWRGRPTHLNRIQDFYVLRPEDLSEERAAVRRAELSDLDDIVDMSERMLREDFALAQGSLSRDGIRDSMRRKIRDGQTWVVREGKRMIFKVDVAAQFAGGAQVEGVFTRPDFRGRGYARRGVAGVCAELLQTSRFVSLHVARENAAARRAYEAVGFRPFGEFRLVLLKTA
jgi:ribosomal protein S18 acetylase RimI-like enzyme